MTVTAQSPSIVRSGHVAIGVDTHKHIHVAAVLDPVGGILATLTISTETAGYRRLLEWAAGFGQIIAFGIEGTGSYGAALTSCMRRAGHKVVEVNRPNRRLRRMNGNPTPWMPRTPPGRCWPATPRLSRSPPTGRWK